MSLTPAQVKAFWAHMQNEFGATVEEKNDALVMQVAAQLLDALKIQDKEQFMKDYVTTLYKTIYIPFEIGVEGADGRWSLWSQVRVAVHENQHVVQGEREGWPVFGSRYLTDSSYRAGYEAECYGCDMEMEYWRLGAVFDPHKFALERALGLKSYGCTDADIEQAQQMLSMRADLIVQGVIETKAAQIAIPWLEKNVPDLQQIA